MAADAPLTNRVWKSPTVSGRLVACNYKEGVTQSQAVLDIADLPWQHATQQYARLGAAAYELD
jgi:hypothetical protein